MSLDYRLLKYWSCWPDYPISKEKAVTFLSIVGCSDTGRVGLRNGVTCLSILGYLDTGRVALITRSRRKCSNMSLDSRLLRYWSCCPDYPISKEMQ
ncbi:hypothetical protein J6590_094734 [Homalodisca vitripennis]|nr:hypothetical protein J6590_085139 [Homalodisca vitripennis]KAG8324339.1 hypothetical protein J6590_094734 [Homalodisca vitripennis]